MSAFQVFGVSWQKLHDAHYKKSKRLGEGKSSGPIESISEFDARMRLEADALFAAETHLKPLSEKFDAPQFAEEFVRLCDPSRYKLLTIRVNAIQQINEQSGKVTRKWVTYERGKQYKVAA